VKMRIYHVLISKFRLGDGLECLHHKPASRRRLRKGNPVPGVELGHPVTGNINTETCSSRLGVGVNANDFTL
jgi:hypothetical protein